jgi:hypothetical protein
MWSNPLTGAASLQMVARFRSGTWSIVMGRNYTIPPDASDDDDDDGTDDYGIDDDPGKSGRILKKLRRESDLPKDRHKRDGHHHRPSRREQRRDED